MLFLTFYVKSVKAEQFNKGFFKILLRYQLRYAAVLVCMSRERSLKTDSLVLLGMAGEFSVIVHRNDGPVMLAE